jgi:hypothetical protein
LIFYKYEKGPRKDCNQMNPYQLNPDTLSHAAFWTIRDEMAGVCKSWRLIALTHEHHTLLPANFLGNLGPRIPQTIVRLPDKYNTSTFEVLIRVIPPSIINLKTIAALASINPAMRATPLGALIAKLSMSTMHPYNQLFQHDNSPASFVIAWRLVAYAGLNAVRITPEVATPMTQKNIRLILTRLSYCDSTTKEWLTLHLIKRNGNSYTLRYTFDEFVKIMNHFKRMWPDNYKLFVQLKCTNSTPCVDIINGWYANYLLN